MKKKKNKLTNLFKTGTLFFGVSLFFFSCEKEEIERQNEESLLTYEIISFKEFINTKKNNSSFLDRSLDYLNNSKNLISKNSEKNSFVIDPSRIVSINHKNNYTSYTLPIVSAPQTYISKNIMLSIAPDGTETAHLVEYKTDIPIGSLTQETLKYHIIGTRLTKLTSPTIKHQSREMVCVDTFTTTTGICSFAYTKDISKHPDCYLSNGEPKVSVIVSVKTECTSSGGGSTASGLDDSGFNLFNFNNSGSNNDLSFNDYHHNTSEENIDSPCSENGLTTSFDDGKGNCIDGLTTPLIAIDDDQIILDSTFENHQRLKCVYNKFKSDNNKISNYLNKFLPDNAVGHLNFKADNDFAQNHPNSTTAGAITSPPVNGANNSNVANYNIDIIFNTDPNLPNSYAGGKPTIILAVELIHETVHAEMYRKLLECAQLPHVNYTQMTETEYKNFIYNLRNNYEGLYDYFMRYKFYKENGVLIPIQGPTTEQHNQMATHYRDMVKEAIKDFDNNQHSDEFYDALSWIGLKNTVAWSSNTNQSAINTIITNAMTNETKKCTN